MPDDAAGAVAPQVRSIESRSSWVAAGVSLAILSVAYGATLLIVVGMRAMEQSLHVDRAALSLGASFTWLGTGLGGIFMGWLSDRIGMRASVTFGSVMVSAGLALAATGHLWAIYVGQGVLIGFLGMGAIYPPLVVYVSRWFDRRRGTAVALISSGQYIAGVAWPSAFAWMLVGPGWQAAYLAFAGVVLVWVIPLAVLFLRPLPSAATPSGAHVSAERAGPVLGLPPNVVQLVLCAAGFCCCIPMSIPQTDLVAFCGDIGIRAETGALMLSVLLGCAFISRQVWGLFADHKGGLVTVFACSSFQALAIFAFMLTRNEGGLFGVAAFYGFGFSGLIPSYILTIRELFPSSQASWRVPLVLFTSMSGMAVGAWFAGVLYDHFALYGPVFAFGLLFNVANLVLVGSLVLRQQRRGGYRAARLAPAAG